MSPAKEAPLGPLAAKSADEISSIMETLDVSGAELARRIGRSQGYVAIRLRKELAFNLTDFEDIANALGIDPVKLLARAASRVSY